MVYGTNHNVGTDWGNLGFTGTGSTQGTGTTFNGFTDGASSLGGVWGNNPYLADAGFPTLTAVILGLSNLPNGTQGDPEFTPTHAFYESFTQNLEQLIDKHGLNDQQVSQLVFAHMTGATPDDTFIAHLATELEAQVAGDMAEMFDLPSTTDQGRFLKESGSSHIQSTKEQIQSLKDYANSLPEGSEKQALQQKINEMTQNINQFEQQLSSLPDPASREQLADLSKQLGQTNENLRQLAGELSTLGGNNPELNSVLAHFESSISSNTGVLDNLFGELVLSHQLSTGDFSGLTSDFKNVFVNSLTQAFDAEFEAQLEKFLPGDPEMQAQARYAHYNPDGVPQNIKDLAAQIENAAIQQMNQDGWTIPEGYTPPSDSNSFSKQLQNTADNLFEAALENYVGADGKPLTLEQQNQIRNMYHGIIPPDGAMGKISAELEAFVAAELMVSMGLPEGAPVPKGSLSRAANINGQFQMKFMELLNSLSPDQKAKVLQAINDPLNPAVSAETKALLEQLFNQALGSIKTQFGLPDSFSLPVGILRDFANMSPTTQKMLNAANEMGTGVAIAIGYVQSWPSSPMRTLLLNVLKVVSDAIAELKAQVAIIAQLDSELSSKLGKAQLEAALTKVAENLKKLQEIKDKQQKMKDLAPLMKFMKVLTFIFAAVMCLVAGPVGIAILGVLIADMAINGLDGDESLIGQAFDAIFEFVSEILSFLGEPLNEIAAILVNVMICIALAMTGSIMLGIQIFFEHSGIIQTFFTEVCGCDPMVGEIVAMALQMVVEIVMMIVLTIVTGGAAGALLVASIAGRVAQMTAKVVQQVITVIAKVAQLLQKIAMAAQKFARLSQVIMKVSFKLVQLANKLVNVVTKLTNWATKMGKLADQIARMSKHVKWTKQAQAVFSKSGKTGHMGYDVAMKTFRMQIDTVKWIYRAFAAAITGVQIATVAVTVNNHVVAADIARIRGDLESLMVELEAFIAVMKKMLQKLLEGLQGMGEWMAQIGQQQSDMWKEASQTMDAVAGANQAA
jgi:hypothetical protein